MLPGFFKNLGPIDLEQVKQSLNCEILNVNINKVYKSLVSISNIDEHSLCFIYDNQSIKDYFFDQTTVICTEKKSREFCTNQSLIIVDDVQYACAVLSNLFYRELNDIEINSLPSVTVGKKSIIAETSKIKNGVVIGDNVTIKDGAQINYNCVIGNNSCIGNNAIVTNSIIGENVNIGPNCSIGQQGFGFAINKSKNVKIFHIGRVVLQSNVNLGANCTIDRGSFSDTVIGENTYFDNLCHVAHNVTVGNNSIFAAMTGIAGSAIIGDNVMTGGQSGIAGHIKIGNNVRIAAKSAVFNSVDDNQSVMGNPAINMFKYLKKYKKYYG